MTTREFTKTLLVDELDLPDNDDIVVYREVVDTTRWSIIYELVFAYEGKFYKANYGIGATEQQDESPWEYEDVIKAVEVEPKEVKITEWVPVT